ncbi:glycosyltransferase family 2 protein [Helicobacter cappadocius]|uniref:Glycosyltransferase family 2 protein n=1 Tax=Helicobacter cappadocius TaxID=3063998 RepID=A0AA90PRD3_9HELI|nr:MULTISPECIES: glycosyltransferase family 2 protein [unclassified Helicobacter]MDO7253603.1 glycosyltransferase family 2 protein [Helicobacter sp. faydin-H75]MDP2539531.1 glycosyltransferase family 2 protein [Helicobacter sp. faydin-H76]
MKNHNYPKISIITVVYNDAIHIADTIESVLSQDYPNIQYIIIDGNSTDGTKQIIQNYIDAKPPHLKHCIDKFISEKDKGIYDAMNKGIDLATGEWCNFMNSGDRFYEHSTITKCFEKYKEALKVDGGGGGISVIYGNSDLFYDALNHKIIYSHSQNHKYHHRFIHQSAFIDSKVMKKYRYDTNFKIAGDTDFFTKIFNKGYGFKKIDLIVSVFNLNGISSAPSFQMLQEEVKITYRYNRFYPIFLSLKYITCILPRFVLRSMLPKSLKNKLRVIFSKNSF